MALKKGTVLVAKNYIKCYGIGRQFEVGTEFVYLFSYEGCYMVQRSTNGKVYDSGNELPQYSGEGGLILAVKPCDVEVSKEFLMKEKALKQKAQKLIKELGLTRGGILGRSARPDEDKPFGVVLCWLRDYAGIPKSKGCELADKILEIFHINNGD